MGRRNDIDWEAIERDYRAGQLSVREIAAKHNVAPSSITRRAEGKGWSRDLTEAVQARTKALLATTPATTPQSAQRAQQSAQRTATPSADLEARAVEEAAATNVQVVLNHRKAVARARELAAGMLEELAEAGTTKDKRKKIDLRERVTMVKSLSEALRIQVGVERQAFGIVEGDKSLADPLGQLIAELQKNRSALPIVELAEG